MSPRRGTVSLGAFALLVLGAACAPVGGGRPPGTAVPSTFAAFTPACPPSPVPTLVTLPSTGPTPMGTPDLTAASCGFPQTPALSYEPGQIAVCTPGAGCAQNFFFAFGGVTYGEVTASAPGRIASVTFQQNGLGIQGLSPGTTRLFVQDAAEGLSQSIDVTVVGSGTNDGTLTLGGLSGALCLGLPEELEYTSSAPVTIAVSDPSALSVSGPTVNGRLTDYEVTPLSVAPSVVTATAGTNVLVAPITVETCRTTGPSVRLTKWRIRAASR